MIKVRGVFLSRVWRQEELKPSSTDVSLTNQYFLREKSNHRLNEEEQGSPDPSLRSG